MTTSVRSYKYYEGLVFNKEFSMFYRVMSRVLIQIKLPSQVSLSLTTCTEGFGTLYCGCTIYTRDHIY